MVKENMTKQQEWLTTDNSFEELCLKGSKNWDIRVAWGGQGSFVFVFKQGDIKTYVYVVGTK